MNTINKIDYASLYGVKPGETDFANAMKRSLKKDVKHLDKYVKLLLKKKK